MYPNCKVKITSLQSRKHIVLSLSPTGATKGPGVMSSYQCLLCLGGATGSWWHVTFFQHASFLYNLYTNCWAFSKPHRVTLSPLISGSHFLLTLPNYSCIHTNWPTPSWPPDLLTSWHKGIDSPDEWRFITLTESSGTWNWHATACLAFFFFMCSWDTVP